MCNHELEGNFRTNNVNNRHEQNSDLFKPISFKCIFVHFWHFFFLVRKKINAKICWHYVSVRSLTQQGQENVNAIIAIIPVLHAINCHVLTETKAVY